MCDARGEGGKWRGCDVERVAHGVRASAVVMGGHFIITLFGSNIM